MKIKDYILAAVMLGLIMMLAMGQVSGQDFYSNLNKYRRTHLLPALKRDTTLESKALIRVHRIQTQYQGTLVHGQMNQSGFDAEVLAKDCDLACWLESPSHRKILMSRKARRIGFIRINGIACARLN